MNSRTVNVCSLCFLFFMLLMAILGCMESLVYYKTLLLRKHSAQLSADTIFTLNTESVSLLNTLQDIDPSRKQRYVDLGEFSHGISC